MWCEGVRSGLQTAEQEREKMTGHKGGGGGGGQRGKRGVGCAQDTDMFVCVPIDRIKTSDRRCTWPVKSA